MRHLQFYLHLKFTQNNGKLKKSLMIDDEEKLQSMLSWIIRPKGLEIFEAATIKAATKILDKETGMLYCAPVKYQMEKGYIVYVR